LFGGSRGVGKKEVNHRTTVPTGKHKPTVKRRDTQGGEGVFPVLRGKKGI